MAILIHNIATLVHIESDLKLKYNGIEMSSLQILKNAFLFIVGDVIHSFGLSENSQLLQIRKNTPELIEIDAIGGCVFPSWCDSHTHLVYGGSRENEFVDRIRGLTYEEIFNRGGGIHNSARLIQKASEDELFESASERMNEIMRYGTGAVAPGLSLPSTCI